MRAIRIPVNEEQYAEAVKSIEDFNPDIVILDMDLYMMMLKVLSAPVPFGKNKAQKITELINKIDAYIKGKFKVYHLYAPEFASDVVREEKARTRTFMQRIREEIFALKDAFSILSTHLRTKVYSYLKLEKKLAEASKEFLKKIENKKFESTMLNKLMEVWVYKRAYKMNEVTKIASENQQAKILYIGIKSSFLYLPVEK